TGDGTHLVADAMTLSGPASVYSAFSNDATFGVNVIVRAPCGGGACAYPPPILEPFPTAPVVTPGTLDILVPRRTTMTIPAGDYGKLKVRGRSTIVLTGGTYNFAEFKTGTIVRVLFTAPTIVNVA